MFDFLKDISLKVYERYLTLEKNIKSGSNSFYDSFLDLQEEMLRLIVTELEIDIHTRRSFGELLRIDEVKDALLEKVKLSKFAYDKMLDYSLKINAHKHKGEKIIQLEVIIKYTSIFYQLASKYALYKGIIPSPYAEDYYADIFNCFEKENYELKRQIEEYRELFDDSILDDEEKEKYELLLSYAEISNRSLEEQNAELKERLVEIESLKEHIDSRFRALDERLCRIEGGNKTQKVITKKAPTPAEQIFKFSLKSYLYSFDKEEWKSRKLTFVGMFAVSIMIQTFTMVFGILFFGYYTTYMLFENIWSLLSIFVAFYIIKSSYNYDATKYSLNTIECFYNDSYGIPRKKKTKARYVVFLVLSLISSACHLFLASYDNDTNKSFLVWFCIFEVLTIASVIIEFIYAKVFFSGYSIMLHTVKNQNGQIEVFMDDTENGKLVPIDTKIVED